MQALRYFGGSAEYAAPDKLKEGVLKLTCTSPISTWFVPPP